MVNTIQQNYERYTNRDIERVPEARTLQAKIGHPFQKDYEDMVYERLLENCPLLINDIRTAHISFGPELAGLRGKTMQQKPEHVNESLLKPSLGWGHLFVNT